MSGLVRAILYRMFDAHRDEVNIAIRQRDQAIAALEKIAKSTTEKDQQK